VGKQFEIGQVAIDPLSLCTTLAMREVDPADYDWSVGDEIGLSAPSIERVPATSQSVPGWDAIPINIQDAAGVARRPAIRMLWNWPLPGVTGIAMQVRVKATGHLIFNGSTSDMAQGAYQLQAGVLPLTTYQTRGRLIGPALTEWTGWADAEVTTTGIYTNTVDLAGQAVTVPARIWRPTKVRLTNSTWVRFASLTLVRVAGFATDFDVAFSFDGFGTAVVGMRILRGSTQIAAASSTTGERGSQMQGGWTAQDSNTDAGSTTYHLEFRQGQWAGNDFDVNVWNVFFKAQQVKR
jgi:hypothetical protein